MGERSFGKRTTTTDVRVYRRTRLSVEATSPPTARMEAEAPSFALPASTGITSLSHSGIEDPVHAELREWKQRRRQQARFNLPWRQISLMASLSFGIASFVLPDTVNEAVGWLLDLLALVAFGAWLSGRKKRDTSNTADQTTAIQQPGAKLETSS